ncbi:MAG: hypothetical protein ABS939_18565 [Psychrobacillus sp.]|nr:hypothetical protein [Psychrobacillus sp. BL-248-WT-3]
MCNGELTYENYKGIINKHINPTFVK